MFSSKKTSRFYDQLMEGKEKRGFLGKDRRYNPRRVLERSSTKKYFLDVVRPFIEKTDKVLDFGCGPGTFLAATAPLCASIVGIDISRKFIEECQQTIADLSLSHARAIHVPPDEPLPFEEESFDVLLMVDVIHHLEDRDTVLRDAFRFLKPGGRVIIYEPNKLNPLIALVHLCDPHEWGLLKVGTPDVYRRMLLPLMSVERIAFNGIVIGPESKVWTWISDVINAPACRPVLGWLNPKIFVTGTKK